jgi:glutathione S-transferase
MPTTTLYEFTPTRSARARWTLLELDIPYESIEGRQNFGSEALRRVHPLGKMPALIDDGRPLFESAAICNWLADSRPEKRLIAEPGTWQRALHDQWVAFTLAELEAHLWSTARNTFVYPEEKRIPAIIPQNAGEAKRALGVLDGYLSDREYLVDGRFTVADIFTGYAVNWARRAGLADDVPHVQAYLGRLFARPLCTLDKS